MTRPTFVLNTPYQWELIPLGVGELDGDDLSDEWKFDARGQGLWVARLLAKHFNNLSQIGHRDGNRLRGVRIQGTGDIYKTTCASKDGDASLVPSKMKGVGRSFDLEDFRTRTAEFDGWIVADFSRMPVIRVCSIHKSVCEQNQWLDVPRHRIDRMFVPNLFAQVV